MKHLHDYEKYSSLLQTFGILFAVSAQLTFILSLVVVNATTYRYTDNFDAAQIPTDAKNVYVNNYPLNILTSGMFSNLTQCGFLFLERTSISEIEPGTWLGLDKLRTVRLGL